MLTKKDISIIEKLSDEKSDKLIDVFTKLHYETKEELEKKIVQFKDDILTEIKKLREDVTVVTGYKDQVENHESRISKLESILSSV